MDVKACMDYLTEQARLREEVVQASKVFITVIMLMVIMVIMVIMEITVIMVIVMVMMTMLCQKGIDNHGCSEDDCDSDDGDGDGDDDDGDGDGDGDGDLREHFSRCSLQTTCQ